MKNIHILNKSIREHEIKAATQRLKLGESPVLDTFAAKKIYKHFANILVPHFLQLDSGILEGRDTPRSCIYNGSA